MKYKELVNLKPAELEKKEHEATYELIKLRAQVATGTNPKNPGQIKQLKKMLAKINTIKTQQAKNNKLEETKKDA